MKEPLDGPQVSEGPEGAFVFFIADSKPAPRFESTDDSLNDAAMTVCLLVKEATPFRIVLARDDHPNTPVKQLLTDVSPSVILVS